MANYVCEFGNVHACDRTCDCPRKYKCTVAEFRNLLVKKFGISVEEPFRYKTRVVMAKPLYPSDVTDRMRDEVVRELTSQ